ncbi:hemerythrin domain-containing protein [Sunxiuqinia dokdonensis]|uniref:Hemerythrin-like domain-containing protein n=1 Tax=Sunxiuqinia dokdonensis TaxID=1409788 RepID=A0A0L8VDR3_9BACT|nr:hemerythrin domain-containing protein [Sunxiuqinia dokdonensis]KOH46498.1 hypothetical protein NC99_06370 [Sunxiuqinia dokdonensis]
MELFRREDKMSSLITRNYNLLPVINRFGIRLGFKEKTIAEVCQEKNIDTDFFLAIVNTYTDESYFPEAEFLSFSPVLLIDYLKNTHRYYINYVLPKIEQLLNKVMESCPDNCSSLKMINTFYQKYKSELLLHLKLEDEKVFPYILNLYENKTLSPEGSFIEVIENEHTNVEVKLSDLENLIIRHLSPNYEDNAMNEFLTALLQFENDLNDHARIEDHILITKVIEFEKELKK